MIFAVEYEIANAVFDLPFVLTRKLWYFYKTYYDQLHAERWHNPVLLLLTEDEADSIITKFQDLPAEDHCAYVFGVGSSDFITYRVIAIPGQFPGYGGQYQDCVAANRKRLDSLLSQEG